MESGARELRALLDEVDPNLKLYSNLREKRFASTDVLSKNIKGKYRQALGSVVRNQLSVDFAGSSQADSTTADAESEDEDDPEDSNDPDDPEIDASQAARAGACQTLSATARNTLRLRAAAAALCGSSGDDDDGSENANEKLAKILRECQFVCAQINAFIRDQNPSRLLRFCDQEVLGAYDAPGAATFAIRDVVAVAFLGRSKWFTDFGLIHELTYASSRGTAHHGRAITAARSTAGAMAQLQFYTRQLAVMGQQFRLIGDEKFALDERGRDVLSFSAADVQSPEPVSIAFVLCRVVPMIEIAFGDEKRWVPNQDSHFLVEQAIAGLDGGLDVDDAISAAAELLDARREAAEHRGAPAYPPASKAPRLMPKILPTNKGKVVGGKHCGRKGKAMGCRGGYWRVEVPVVVRGGDGGGPSPSAGTGTELVSVRRGDLDLDVG